MLKPIVAVANMSSDSDDDIPLGMLKKQAAVKPDPAPSSSSTVVKKKKRKASSVASNSNGKQKVSAGSAKKKQKVKKEGDTRKSKPISSSSSSSKVKAPRELKKLEKAERLQYAMQSFLWWDAEDPPPGCQWRTMEHAGVSFPESYEPHGINMLYSRNEVKLTPLQEEA